MSDASQSGPPTPSFRRGADEAEKAASYVSFGDKVHYLSLEDQETQYVRFIDDADAWVIVDQYSMVPTKPKPADYSGENWPKTMGAVSRRDPAFQGFYKDDYIADFMRKPDGKPYKASAKTWTRCCLREEVIGDGSPALGGPENMGKRLGFRDKTRTVKRKGDDGVETEVVEKDIRVCNQGYKNFFTVLEGYYRTYGTLVDRDYLIKRKGVALKTDYQFVPLDPVPAKDPQTGEVKRLDLRDPAFADRYKCDVDLVKIITNMASDDFYERFFDTRVGVAAEGGDAAPVEQQAKPNTEPTDERLKSMMDRVKALPTEQSTDTEKPNGNAGAPVAPAAAPTPAPVYVPD